MAIYQGSRYVTTTLKTYDRGVPLISIRQPVVFDPNKCEHYIVQRGDRIDSIAFIKYGRADLYWAILNANPQYFSELDINVGDVLLIPHLREVVKVANV